MADDRPAQRPPARFVTGSIPRHILVVTGTSAIGLMAVFIGEFVSLLYLGLLRDQDVLAALGYAAVIQFFSTSVGIGLSIGATSVVAPAVGAGDMVNARRVSANALLFAALLGAALVLLILPLLSPVLTALGARDRVHTLALQYLWIVMPTLPLRTVGMTTMAILRSVGDAERSMNVPLIGSATQAAVEPFFIFMLRLGMAGAALAYVVGAVAFTLFGLYGVFLVHRLWKRPERAAFRSDSVSLLRVAGPAVTTNVATPLANMFTTGVVATFGDAAVAAWAIVGRVTPVAFGVVFALTGAIGPIIGQNYGARTFERVHDTFKSALQINAMLCAAGYIGLALLTPVIVKTLATTPEAAGLIQFYCYACAPLMVFLGMLFISNAAFNTLGHAHVATMLNWGRATLGTIPFVWIGGKIAGAPGVFFGSIGGSVLFGLISVWLARRILPRI